MMNFKFSVVKKPQESSRIFKNPRVSSECIQHVHLVSPSQKMYLESIQEPRESTDPEFGQFLTYVRQQAETFAQGTFAQHFTLASHPCSVTHKVTLTRWRVFCLERERERSFTGSNTRVQLNHKKSEHFNVISCIRNQFLLKTVACTDNQSVGSSAYLLPKINHQQIKLYLSFHMMGF